MKRKIHKSITWDRLEDALRRQMFELDNPGFCIKCGEEVGGCEPDTTNGRCDVCETNTVFGAEWLIGMFA